MLGDNDGPGWMLDPESRVAGAAVNEVRVAARIFSNELANGLFLQFIAEGQESNESAFSLSFVPKAKHFPMRLGLGKMKVVDRGW